MTDMLDILQKSLGDRYLVERELGSGGMAVVYLARDVKHDRPVALKVMRPELSASLGAGRFLREIGIAAKLSHPHILALYDSGEADGLLYYVMPFVEGESLRDLLDREQQLSLEDSVRITREVAEALSQAHSYGIIHRDIKPENIMLSGGHAIVADFGIARALSAAGGDNLTQTGTAVGTPAYMSPEQSGGDPSLDGRSDIYSLGCVLYEMLVGQVPFTGPSAQAIMARHTMDAVTPPSIMRQSVPEELEDVILRALEKAPADRFRTAAEFAEALVELDSGTYSLRRTTRAVATSRRRRRRRRVTAGLSAVGVIGVGIISWQLLSGGNGSDTVIVDGLDPTSVAVLYFEDLSPDKDLAYVVDGITEGLIDRLSTVRALDVVSRNGVEQYRDQVLPRDSIARLLEVGSIITGAVEQVGDRLRVTVRLVDGISGADLDRELVDVPAADLLAMQDSVVDQVSRIMRERIGDEVRTRQRRASTSSTDAWALVQRGQRLLKDGFEQEAEDLDRAARTYIEADSLAELAERLDKDWIDPLLVRGEAAYSQSFVVESEDDAVNWLHIGIEHADRALERSPGNADALALRGKLKFRIYRLDVTPDPREQALFLDEAQADMEAAVAADPSLAHTYFLLSNLYYARDDLFKALMAARNAYEEDAYLRSAGRILNQLFYTHYDLRQFTDATRWCTEGARRFPDDYRFVECQLWLLIVPGGNADVERAWELYETLMPLVPERLREEYDHMARMVVGGVLARVGMVDSASAVLDNARAGLAVDENNELLSYEAVMRVINGQQDEAVDLLTRYVALNPDHSFDIEGDLHWWWEDLRNHPGFQRLAKTDR